MFPKLNSLKISGADALPLIEGGKGVSITTGASSGAWAATGGVGTFSGVNADEYDKEGNIIKQVYSGLTRIDRHEELVDYAIKGGIAQARVAHDMRKNAGRLHVNILWEMGAAERVLIGILEKAGELIDGVTCGAGMPYRLGDISAKFRIFYYPIISSARAFKILYKRAYIRSTEWLGGVVYEDPWLAGGHNGLSNNEDPLKPEDPLPRVLELRKEMCAVGLSEVPIIMAGGVWYLRDWIDWLDNKDIGPIAFQFGTRALLTRESPIPDKWKKKLLTLNKGDTVLHRFSPTNFWSSAVKNNFIKELMERGKRQLKASLSKEGKINVPVETGKTRKRVYYFSKEEAIKAKNWIAQGFKEVMKTPDNNALFVSAETASQIRTDQKNCMGCLSQCKFSNWADNSKHSTGKKADPRSFCIQKTLQDIVHDGNLDTELMFAGHNAWRFNKDPFYSNGFVPSVKQLVERILSGD